MEFLDDLDKIQYNFGNGTTNVSENYPNHQFTDEKIFIFTFSDPNVNGNTAMKNSPE